MTEFPVYVKNEKFREELEVPSLDALYSEAVARREKIKGNPEVGRLIADSFGKADSVPLLLSANGMLLQFAGPTIRKNYYYAKIAVNQNGEAIRFVSPELLKNPEIVADLILSATVGYPCEALRSVIHDENYILEVCKKIVELEPTRLAWVCGHMRLTPEQAEMLRGKTR